MIRVFLVDDHQVVIEGMQLLLSGESDIQPVGFAMSGEEALEKLRNVDADIVLLDINMPGMSGIDTCAALMKQWPQMRVIALSMLSESSLIKMMLRQGASGYILKNSGRAEVLEAIRSVHGGNRYLSQEVNDIVLDSISRREKKRASNPFPQLSRREKEVLALIVDENTTQEIADKLFISFGTVETHRRNMLIKLGARNTAGLVRVAMEYHLLDEK